MKISFDKNNYKTVERYNDRFTTVHLTGTLYFPEELEHTLYNKDIKAWAKSYSNPKIETSIRQWSIKVKGEATRNEKDTNDPVLGERIAEGRAKIKIYKFMVQLLKRCVNTYIKTLFGNVESSLSEFAQQCSLYDTYIKYQRLLEKEQTHLQELING